MKRLIVFVLGFMTLFSDLYSYESVKMSKYENIEKLIYDDDKIIQDSNNDLLEFCCIDNTITIFIDEYHLLHYIKDNYILKCIDDCNIETIDMGQKECNQLKKFKLDNYFIYFVDLTFDNNLDIIHYNMGGFDCNIFFENFLEQNKLFECLSKTSYDWIEIKFCILNGKRGFLFQDYDYNDKLVWSFYYWSPSEQRYILDETATQVQIKNAYCPEEYFAYNGLDFSKLDKALKKSDIKDLTPAQLRLMRNAIYARHGRIFTSVDLQSLWECYTWYKPNPDYNDSMLTKTDKKNLKLIQDMEKVTGTYVPDLPR